MRNSSLKSVYFIGIGILLLSMFFIYLNKERKKQKFSVLKDFTYKEVDGYNNTTKNLPQHDGYIIFLFNPDCEVCHKEAENISVNLDLFRNCCMLYLSPDSLNRIKSFVYKYHLHENENVFYGQINIDTIRKKFGISKIPRIYIYDRNKKLKKSGSFLTVQEIEKILLK